MSAKVLRWKDVDLDNSVMIFEQGGYMLDDKHFLRIEDDGINIFSVKSTSITGVVTFDKRRKTVLDLSASDRDDLDDCIDLEKLPEMNVLDFFRSFIK